MIKIHQPIAHLPLRATLSQDGRSITEKVLAKDGTLTRIQTEHRAGLVFMRAKKRVIYALRAEPPTS